MLEYIQVQFRESREVVIDDNTSGQFVGDVIEVDPGSHEITLTGAQDYLPAVKHINPTGTSPLAPLIVQFS